MLKKGEFNYLIIMNDDNEFLSFSRFWTNDLTYVRKYTDYKLATTDAEKVNGTVVKYMGDYLLCNEKGE